jgi:hypothetical protein
VERAAQAADVLVNTSRNEMLWAVTLVLRRMTGEWKPTVGPRAHQPPPTGDRTALLAAAASDITW